MRNTNTHLSAAGQVPANIHSTPGFKHRGPSPHSPTASPSSIHELSWSEVLKQPTPEQARVLNDLHSGVSILKESGLAVFLDSASTEKNGNAEIHHVTLASQLKETPYFSCLPRHFIPKLAIELAAALFDSSAPTYSEKNADYNVPPPQVIKSLLISTAFTNVNLGSPQFKGANLSNLQIYGTGQQRQKTQSKNRKPLAPPSLNGTTLTHSKLTKISLNKANFVCADLTGTTLKSLSSRNANYTAVKLTDATLIGVDFRGSNFSQADLTGIHCERVNFSGVNLTGANVSFSPAFIEAVVASQEQIDAHINHLNNDDQGLLISINSIDNHHEELKNALMETVVSRLAKLPDSQLSNSWDSLANILLNEPLYSKAPLIAEFVRTRLLPRWAEQKNQALIRSGEVNLALTLEYFNHPQSSVDWSAPEYQGVVNQLLYSANLSPNDAPLHLLSQQLRTTYMSGQKVKDAVTALEHIDPGSTRESYLFTCTEGQQALALEPELFGQLVGNGPLSTAWTNAYLLKRSADDGSFENIQLNTPKTVYAMQPFLKTRYGALMQGELVKGLVRNILGNTQHSTTFTEALDHYSSTKKLVSCEAQKELYATFAPFWQVAESADHLHNTTRRLYPEHQEQLWQSISDTGPEDTPRNRAMGMLCLAAIFTRYSSSVVLGTETESPHPVRLYASALLNEAVALDPALVDHYLMSDWQKRLLGIAEAFTCTAILSNMMKDQMNKIAQRDNVMASIYSGLYPAAWH
ncbi:pentapeptide repeat-containing protein [Pseudomonas chlororaphis subsp. aurantiaca]|uniref:pentapeptide repeat-containing protein n=1 Tax=Pseudomonas chlororaphis TaxID=587753 RepID=UPI0027DC442D|nr:pentapeptide repeat-containing protein [Pseudomonas chlororaphis]WMI97532.1 pentapeptide repeat-containing protein [Pseudomonas chlororaphis subsp. aurantiaca]